jgi:hypothetical protein
LHHHFPLASPFGSNVLDIDPAIALIVGLLDALGTRPLARTIIIVVVIRRNHAARKSDSEDSKA